jgi:uncharacterized protein (TIGR01244 family)
MTTRRAVMTTALLFALAGGCGGQGSAAPERQSPTSGGEATAAGSTPAEGPESIGIPNEAHPREGLTTGGQPSDESLHRAAEQGYRTVISLRTQGEPGSEGEGKTVRELGMDYVSIPIDAPGDVNEQKARELTHALDEAERPVLLHCGSSNRAGALLALEAFFVDGMSKDEALELGREAGMTRLEPVVKERITQACKRDPERDC